MTFDGKWVSPESMPGLPVVCPATSGGADEDGLDAMRVRLLRFVPSNGGGGERYRPSEEFYVSQLPYPNFRTSSANPWNWPKQPPLPSLPGMGPPRVWPPCDNLLFATAFEAALVARDSIASRTIWRFEGSLFDGIAIKPTLRSAICGENAIYVREREFAETISDDDARAEPTAFIFETPGADTSTAAGDGDWKQWSITDAGIERAVLKRPDLRRALDQLGRAITPGIGYVRDTPVPDHLRGLVVSSYELKGITIFGNPCLDSVQEGNFLAETEFRRCPVARTGGLHGLLQMYRERLDLRIDLEDWPTALILFAIPYAQRFVTLIVPDHYMIQHVVRQAASRFRIRLSTVPLSQFPADQMREVRTRIEVYASDKLGTIYDEELERRTGQKKDDHLDRLPARLRAQSRLADA
jgi:hypothetical protein